MRIELHWAALSCIYPVVFILMRSDSLAADRILVHLHSRS